MCSLISDWYEEFVPLTTNCLMELFILFELTAWWKKFLHLPPSINHNMGFLLPTLSKSFMPPTHILQKNNAVQNFYLLDSPAPLSLSLSLSLSLLEDTYSLARTHNWIFIPRVHNCILHKRFSPFHTLPRASPVSTSSSNSYPYLAWLHYNTQNG
jgi:hypothetical protein